ncbi:MAG: ABC transporter ATP-binding protein [Acidobacteriota bacterium]
MKLLEVINLRTVFRRQMNETPAVDGVTLSIGKGETLGLVGESGCGKSITALSILRLVPAPGEIVQGEILLEGQDLLKLPIKAMRRIRGRRIAMVFQEPASALNPVLKIGTQVTEGMRAHLDLRAREAWRRGIELLIDVEISRPEECMNAYPHQLSGGMRQRVLIAMALACEPDLLIADEPTTALDVTIQSQILGLLTRMRRQRQLAMLFISHDLGVIAEVADQVAIMSAGQLVEYGPADDIYYRAAHPYTQQLLRLSKQGAKCRS